MTPVLRVVLVVVSILTTAMIMQKIRKSKVRIEDSIFWMAFSFMLIIFSIFPQVADILSDLAGTYSTSNFIFLFVIFILVVKIFRMTIKISQMETKIKELAQKIALDENCREEMERGTLQRTQGVPSYEHFEKQDCKAAEK